MASLPTHAFVAAVLCRLSFSQRIPPRLLWPAALLAMLPDADVVAFLVGIPYSSPWGHRGFSHSLAFAGAAAAVSAWLFMRRQSEPGLLKRVMVCLFLAGASHGFLDALTDGGLGVAFFAPLDNSRYFLPARPLRVSPIGVAAFFSEWGLEVLTSEFLWIWIPALSLLAGLRIWQRGRS